MKHQTGLPTRIVAAVALTVVVAAASVAGVALGGARGAGSTADPARATAKFHDLAVAKRAGYGLLRDKNGVACIAMDDMPAMGAMGVHYAKPPLIPDGKLNVGAPEALVYAPSPDGRLRLAAVE